MTLCPPKSYMCASASLIDEIVRLPKPAFRWPQIQGIPSHIDPSSCLCNGLIQPSPRPRRERVICTTGTTTWMRPSLSCRRLKLGKADMVHLMVGAGKISEDISPHAKAALMAFLQARKEFACSQIFAHAWPYSIAANAAQQGSIVCTGVTSHEEVAANVSLAQAA